MVNNLSAMQETWVRSLVQEDPLEKEMATHSSILAWRILWTEEPGGLQSVGSQRVRHDSHKHTVQSDDQMVSQVTVCKLLFVFWTSLCVKPCLGPWGGLSVTPKVWLSPLHSSDPAVGPGQVTGTSWGAPGGSGSSVDMCRRQCGPLRVCPEWLGACVLPRGSHETETLPA